MRSVLEPLLDTDVVEFCLVRLRHRHQLRQQVPILVVELHVLVVVFTLVANAVAIDQSCDVVRWMRVVEIENVIRHRFSRVVQRRNHTQHVPEVLIGLLVEHATATIDEARVVAQLAMTVLVLEGSGRFAVVRSMHVQPHDGDVLTAPLTVSNQIDGSREVSDAGTDHVGLVRQLGRHWVSFLTRVAVRRPSKHGPLCPLAHHPNRMTSVTVAEGAPDPVQNRA